VVESGRQIAQVARELGINEGTLGNWVARDRQARGGTDASVSESERAELVRLRRELAEAQMERDVLIGSVEDRVWAGRRTSGDLLALEVLA
jgi:transposase